MSATKTAEKIGKRILEIIDLPMTPKDKIHVLRDLGLKLAGIATIEDDMTPDNDRIINHVYD